MKLLKCPHCSDIFNLTLTEKSCSCGKTKGKYSQDGINAIVSPSSVAIGFQNSSFLRALDRQPVAGMGEEFTAFIIPRRCETIHYHHFDEGDVK